MRSLIILLGSFFLLVACGDDDGGSPEPKCNLVNANYNYSVEENTAIGTAIGTVSVEAADGSEVTYSITGGTGENTFILEGSTGEITVAAALDYEDVQEYGLSIQAISATCTPSAINVEISITNENDLQYVDPFYPNVLVTQDLMYGETPNQNMWVYEPVGDNQDPRPLLVFVGGGAYNPSNLTVLSDLATRFAQAGYVVATIRYISNENDVLDPADPFYNLKRSIISSHDVKAAIRYFRKDADSDNLYNIDPDNVFMGGHGTGAFIAIQATYVDDGDVPSEFEDIFNDLGGIEGNRGNPGYSSDAKAVAPFSGAIFDLDQMDEGEDPIICVHSTEDEDVFCEVGQENNIPTYGSCLIIPNAEDKGINSELVLIPGNHRVTQYCQDCFLRVLLFFEQYLE